MPHPLVVVLAALLALAVAVLAAYLVGRAQCPRADWWLSVFVRSGDYACVSG